MEKYRVTPRAEEDLKSIGRYTEQHWGRTQRNVYLKNLENRFSWLAESPGHGRHRSDIAEGYYSFPEGQHIVFYLCSQDGIDIIGIPHKDMDILSYFQTH
jgi:toxin ParE1/3/4